LPSQEIQFLFFERVRGSEELLQFFPGSIRQMTNVLHVGLEWRSVWNHKYAIVAFLLALIAFLLDL